MKQTKYCKILLDDVSGESSGKFSNAEVLAVSTEMIQSFYYVPIKSFPDTDGATECETERTSGD